MFATLARDVIPEMQQESAMKVSRVWPAVLATLVLGCAGSRPAPAPDAAPAPSVTSTGAATPVASTGPDTVAPGITLPKMTRTRPDRQLLTRDAILSTQYTNMYDVLVALRGNWMRIRTAETIQGRNPTLQVYLDNQRMSGGVEELKFIPPNNVVSVRFYDPIQASSRWGMDHGAGALYIISARAVAR